MSSHSLYPIKMYVKYRASWTLILLAAIINFATWVWIVWQIRPQTEPIFLHYNILFGVDFIGAWWKVYSIPLTGLVILIANFLIGWILFNKDKFVSLVVNAVSVLCQIFLL